MAGLCTGVDMIVGFALTHHLKHNITESFKKEAKIVLSSNRLKSTLYVSFSRLILKELEM